MTNEVVALQQAIDKAAARIDNALDRRDRRDFVVWCKKRALLVIRMERLLCQVAAAPVA